MKKLFLVWALAPLMFLVSCGGDDNGSSDDATNTDCDTLTTTAETAATTYITNPTSENCETFKTAAQAVIDAECENASQYQSQLSALSCEDGGVLCSALTVAAGLAFQNYSSNPSTANCQALLQAGEALVAAECPNSEQYEGLLSALNCD